MELTRKAFIAALLGLPGATRIALAFAPSKPESKEIIINESHPPFVLRKGDRLSIRFHGTLAALTVMQAEVLLMEEGGDLQKTLVADILASNHQPQAFYIAPLQMKVVDWRVYYG